MTTRNIPEENDGQMMTEEIIEELGVQGVECTNFERMGEKSEDRHRVVRFTVQNTEKKRKLLAEAKNLKEKDDYKSVYICPDLTKKQQLEGKVLRDELKTRKSNGETNLVIAQGRITTRKKQSTPDV